MATIEEPPSTRPSFAPTPHHQRLFALDFVRGVALFGVLIVNLQTLFRVSLFAHILGLDSAPAWLPAIEFKAFDLFCLCFGAGAALQYERASARLLARRFAILLAFGLIHLILIWNGDILTLYAICGFLLIPFLRLPAKWLAFWAALAILSTLLIPSAFIPGGQLMREQSIQAAAYQREGFIELIPFRWRETRDFMRPLLIATLPKALGAMLFGAAVWRSGLLTRIHGRRRLLTAIAGIGALTGAVLTRLGIPNADIVLAASYGSALLLLTGSNRLRTLAAPLAAVGQTALSNYLAQSLILGWIFYGYGLGLFGRLTAAEASGLSLALYASQMAISYFWLRRFQFGPFEWLWRSLTYGHPQPLRRVVGF